MKQWEILHGDCRDVLDLVVPDCSVQTCVTSPPYFGLRDYGVDGQLGLEASPDEYIEKMVEVFRAVRRVLRDDGTLWLNIGDSYAGRGGRGQQSGQMADRAHGREGRSARITAEGLKDKDLIGIPWLLAFALRADGWYLRQDIIWNKPNPMPESVRDRCTKAHEYIFLLTKSPKYFIDANGLKEPVAASTVARLSQPTLSQQAGSNRVPGNMKAAGGIETRNKRSVWTVATKPFKGAHFASFPPELIKPCIVAGSRPGDIVLDPFGGAGTTAMVANRYGRKSISCELNADYIALAEARVGVDAQKIGVRG